MAMMSDADAPLERRMNPTVGGTTAPTAPARGRLRQLPSVVREIITVILSTGPRPQITRTVQVAGAVSKVLREFARDRKAFEDDNGRVNPPRLLRYLFTSLGSTYVKLGQFIASSPTLFPAEYVLEFQSCLDNAPTVPYTRIRKIIQDDLGKPIAATYNFVDPVPLASASIAQVHRAQLRNGTEVVIKVRKPGVDATLEADLGFLLVSSKIIEFLNPSLNRLSFSGIVGDLRASMLDELDFTKEAQNLLDFRAFLVQSKITDATAPMPYLEASGKRVLTMEYLKGVPLVDLEGIKRFTASPEQTLVTALKTWGLSVANGGSFHADVHGGNLMVLEDGRVGFLDFGIVSKISEPVWAAVSDLVRAVATTNYEMAADALVRMGATTATVDRVKFGRELEAVIEKITTMQPEVTISSNADGDGLSARLTVDEKETTKLVLEVVDVSERNGLKLPREFGLLLKQSLYFDRYQKLLAPTLDPLRDKRVQDALKMYNKFP